MKLAIPVTVAVGLALSTVVLVGCSSTSSRGTAGSGGQAGSSSNPGSGGATAAGTGGATSAGSGGAHPGSGGSSGGATGGTAAGSGGAAAGGHGGKASAGSGGASSGDGGAGGAGMCPSGQRWCAGCTAGSGTCSPGACPGLNCPAMDGGVPDATGGCATATTESDCNGRGVCHPVFVDQQNCRCATINCCTHFSRCAEGAQPTCNVTAVSCTLQTPFCEGSYVVSYADGCYEGCVRASACADGAGGASGPAGGGHGGQGGAGGSSAAGQTCSSAPPIPCPTSQVCDEDMPNRCGAGAVTGHCIVLPQGCTADYTPVCGCDNHTYSNDCERQRARVQLGHTGACT